MSAVRWTATAFAEHVENKLGWMPRDDEECPRWKSLMVMAGRINRRIASNPALYTWDNLLLTVDYLARKRKPATPMGVFYFVNDALQLAPVSEVTDEVAGHVFTAITEAMVAGETDWVDRLARARGNAREIALAEWVKFRG